MIDCFAAKSAFWIDPQGDIRPCARHKQKAFHVTDVDDFANIFSSEYYNNLKSSLDQGEWPTGCQRCSNDEKNSLHSKRLFYTDIELDPKRDVFIDISVGNYCNLKCRMCGPHNSTSWISDYKKLLDEGVIPDFNLNTDPYIIDQEQIDKLCNFVSSIPGRIYIELKGGEPLLMNHTRSMLEQLSNLPNSKSIELLLVTNGTVIPDWFEQCIKNFTVTNLVVSIDGIGDVFDYIRANSNNNYDTVMHNVTRYKKMNVDLKFNVVVQNLNVHQLFDIHKELLKFSNSINYITLFEPKIYRANLISHQQKILLKNKFLLESEVLGEYKETFKNIIEFVNTPADIVMLEHFKKVSLRLDKLRGQNIKEIIPHMFE